MFGFGKKPVQLRLVSVADVNQNGVGAATVDWQKTKDPTKAQVVSEAITQMFSEIEFPEFRLMVSKDPTMHLLQKPGKTGLLMMMVDADEGVSSEQVRITLQAMIDAFNADAVRENF